MKIFHRIFILIFISFIFFFSCTKDKADLVKKAAPVVIPVSYCDSMTTAGKTSFKCFVDSVIAARCANCHNGGGFAPGDFTNYNNIKSAASQIADRIQPNPTTGERMPQGGPFLSSDTIAKIQSWVNDGSLNN